MTVQYVMRATKAGATVYWVVSNAPDMTGIHSGFDPMTLSAITIDCVVNVPTATIGGTITGAAGGDLDGYYANPRVAGLQGRPISANVPSDKQALVYNSGNNSWEPSDAAGGSATLSPQGNWAGVNAINTSIRINVTGTTDHGNLLWAAARDPDSSYYTNGSCVFSLDVSVTPPKLGKVITGLWGSTGYPIKLIYADGYIWVAGYNETPFDSSYSLKQINVNSGLLISETIIDNEPLDVVYNGVDTIYISFGSEYITIVNTSSLTATTSALLTGDGVTPGDYLFYGCFQLAVGNGGYVWTVANSAEQIGNGSYTSFLVKMGPGLTVADQIYLNGEVSNGSIGYNLLTDYIYAEINSSQILSVGPGPSFEYVSTNNNITKIRTSGNNIYCLSDFDDTLTSLDGSLPSSTSINGYRHFTSADMPLGITSAVSFSIVNGDPYLISYDTCTLRKFSPISGDISDQYDYYQNVNPIADYRSLNLDMFTFDASINEGEFLQIQSIPTGNENYKTTYKFITATPSVPVPSLVGGVTGILPAENQRKGQGQGAARIGGAKVITSGARLSTGKTLTAVAGTSPTAIITDNLGNLNKIWITRTGSKDIIGVDLLNNIDGEYESLRDQIFPLFNDTDGYSAPNIYPDENSYPVAMAKSSPLYSTGDLIAIDQNGGIYGIRAAAGSVTSYQTNFSYGQISPIPNSLYCSQNNVAYTATTDTQKVILYFNAASIPVVYQDNFSYPYPYFNTFGSLTFTGLFTSFLYTEFAVSPSQGRFYWIGTDNGEILISTDVYFFEPNPIEVQLDVGAGKTVSAIKEDGYVIYASNREDGFMVMIDPTTLYGTPTMTSGTNLHSGKLIDFCFADGKAWALFDNEDDTGVLIPVDLTAGPGFLTALDPTGWVIPVTPRYCTSGPSIGGGPSKDVVYITAGDSVYLCDVLTVGDTGTPDIYDVGGLVDWV